MFIYFGRTHTATASGSVLKHVNCEHCGFEYGYFMHRSMEASASSPYMVGADSGDSRAMNRAQRKLSKYLESECDMVPCPQCHRFQNNMVRKMRRDRFRGLLYLGIITLCLTPGWCFAALSIAVQYRSIALLISLIVSWIILGGLLIILRIIINHFYDPNNRHEEVRILLGSHYSITGDNLDKLKQQA